MWTAAAVKVLPGEAEPAQDLGFYEQDERTDPLKALFDEGCRGESQLDLATRSYGTVRFVTV